MARKNRNGNYRDNNRGRGDRYDPPNSYRGDPTPPEKNNPFDVAKIAILASVLIVGIVIGFSLGQSGGSGDIARIDSTIQIDRKAPNPEICQQFGASAVVTNMRIFLTLNPFSVYLSQPEMQPGCVLRRTNWSVLEQQKLISNEQVRNCKRRMNTFGFIGALEGKPTIDCIYQNDAAGNLFLNPNGKPDVSSPSENF